MRLLSIVMFLRHKRGRCSVWRLPLPVLLDHTGTANGIYGANGRHPGKTAMHYLRVNTLETERPGCGGGSIDRDGLRRRAHLC